MPTHPYNPYFNSRGNDPDQDQVALFIDWDNLVISNYADRGANRPNIEVIVQKAQQYGTVVIARAYAEWSVMIDRLEVYKAGVEPIYAPVFHSDRDLGGQTGKGKSLADPVMVTDCIDFLHLLPQVGTYVLVTGDKDMMPVVRLAKLRGRRVVVIGPDYVANVLQQVCDEFVPYRLLLVTSQPLDPYAAYYQQPGYYPPPVQPNYYPTQVPQPQPPSSNDSRSRSRRLPGGRRSSSASQPYKDVLPPQPQQPLQPPPYNYYYYGTPQMTQPQAPGYGIPPTSGYPAVPTPPPSAGLSNPPQGQGYPTPPQGYPTVPTPPQGQGYPTPPQGYPTVPTPPQGQGYPT
ncbi:MAG: NYN domain-containing protein, partial [Chloroflexi bacterium]|nr:NYN domain-containing protein [Chloroflexota bacterium]